MIKLIGEGRKQYHKTELIGKGRKQYLKTKLIAIHKEDFDEDDGNDDNENLCQEEVNKMFDCLASKGMTEADQDACGNCLTEAWENTDGVRCYEMEESDFCDDVATCANDVCGNDCSNEVHAAVSCMTNATWCGGYDSECLSGDELSCHDESNEMYECLTSKNVNEADQEVCSNCLNEAWENADDVICFEMEEKGFCDDVAACADDVPQ